MRRLIESIRGILLARPSPHFVDAHEADREFLRFVGRLDLESLLALDVQVHEWRRVAIRRAVMRRLDELP